MKGFLFFFTSFERPFGVVIAGLAGATGLVIAGERVGVGVGVGVADGCEDPDALDPDSLLAAAVGAGLASASLYESRLMVAR